MLYLCCLIEEGAADVRKKDGDGGLAAFTWQSHASARVRPDGFTVLPMTNPRSGNPGSGANPIWTARVSAIKETWLLNEQKTAYSER